MSWIDQPASLLHSTTLIPNEYMTIDEKLNTLTRLIIVITIIIWLTNIANPLIFFVLGIILVIILYYYTRKNVLIENYKCTYCEQRQTPKKYMRFKNKNSI